MASSWIKLRIDLDTDPRVLTMADLISQSAGSYVLNPSARDLLGVTPTVTRNAMRDVTLASLFRVWRDANRHTSDGVFHHCSLDHLDTIAGITGFGRAMSHIGWAVEDTTEHTVTLVNFLEMNSPAKDGRSSAAIRQQRYRQRHSNAPRDVTAPVTKSVDSEAEPESKNSPPPAQERARAAGFPSSEEQARSIAINVGADPDYAATVWHEIEGRGGSDDRGQRVLNFASHLKARWNHKKSREAGIRPPRPAADGVESALPRNAAYAQWKQAMAARAEIKARSFHSDDERQAAATRLHALERQISDLETAYDFTL